jgi:hypothetical protein
VLRIVDILRGGGNSRTSVGGKYVPADSVASIVNPGCRASNDNRLTASVSCAGIIVSESNVAGGIILGLGNNVGGV